MIQIQYVFPPFANKLYINCCYIIFDFERQIPILFTYLIRSEIIFFKEWTYVYQKN
jgi:hypothetical protein